MPNSSATSLCWTFGIVAYKSTALFTMCGVSLVSIAENLGICSYIRWLAIAIQLASKGDKMKKKGEIIDKSIISIINIICFSISLISILFAVTISMIAVWTSLFNEELLWRTLITMGILFFASLVTSITVNYFFPFTRESK